jgi:hypothetical protein
LIYFLVRTQAVIDIQGERSDLVFAVLVSL